MRPLFKLALIALMLCVGVWLILGDPSPDTSSIKLQLYHLDWGWNN